MKLSPAITTLLALALLFASQGFAWTTLPARTNDAPGFVYRQSANDWRDINIYHVMTDRFFNADPTNDDDNPRGTVNPLDPDKIHGGDFEGVQQKLDYLQMLGAKAILLAPVIHNTWGAYQGYGAGDFNQIDPHWGSLADLRALIDAAHARGMYVFFDMVVNHVADLIDSTDAGFPAFRLSPEYTLRWKPEVGSVRHVAPFDTFDKFYMHGEIGNWDDDTQAILGDYPGLDSLRTTNAQVRADFITIYNALIAATDCDGFRADTARHVEMGFWDAFLPAIYNGTTAMGKTNFFVFCEATKGSEPELGPYTQGNRFNSAINFPFNGTINAVFIDYGDTGRLTHHTLPAQLTNYSARARFQLVDFLDSHDEIRYANRLNHDNARLKVAFSYHYTTLHVPYLYYGTEQGFDGADDPNNREDMFDGGWEFGPSLGDNFNYTHELFVHIRKLNLMRAVLTPLRRGGYAERWSTYVTGNGAGLYVFSRTNGTDEVIVALNTTNAVKSATNIPVGYTTGTQLFNLLDPTDTIAVTTGSKIAVTLSNYATKIYYPTAIALPPTVIAASPAHATNNVATTATISLTFDKPMNKVATESAFALSPPVPGTFAWFDGDTRFVFTPSQPLGANTHYALTLNATAAAANAQQLGAVFTSFFDTGGYNSLTVAGTFNGWNPAANNMTLTGSHLWTFDTTFNNASGVQFKFAANGTWDLNWGETNQTQFTIPLAGTGEIAAFTNVLVTGMLNGQYRFQFNDQTFAYALAVYAPPSVTAVAPSNTAFNVPLTATISVAFNKAMDKPSTQSAFSLSPLTTGTFAWFDGDTRFVFTPSAPLAMHTHCTVTVGTGATATNGQQLTAPFTSAFDTGSGYATMSVAGSFNGFSPAVNNMQIVGKNLWQFDTTFNNANNVAFKYAANGTWDINWGDNNPTQTAVPLTGIGENFGADINVTGTLNGNYRFLINDQTGDYALLAGTGAGDTDGDGKTDTEEFLSGTSATNPNDSLRITNIVTVGTNVVIHFTAVPGQQYVLDYKPDITSNIWTQIAGPSATSPLTNVGGAAQPGRIFRVRHLP